MSLLTQSPSVAISRRSRSALHCLSQEPKCQTSSACYLNSSIVSRDMSVATGTVKCVIKGSNPPRKECRFHLPAPNRERAALEPQPGHTFDRFLPIRNDGMLNKYNRLFTIAWMANTDVSPCTSKRPLWSMSSSTPPNWRNRRQGFGRLLARSSPLSTRSEYYSRLLQSL